MLERVEPEIQGGERATGGVCQETRTNTERERGGEEGGGRKGVCVSEGVGEYRGNANACRLRDRWSFEYRVGYLSKDSTARRHVSLYKYKEIH